MSSRIFACALLAPLVTLATAQDTKLETDKQKTGYAIGVQFGKIIEYGKELADLDALMRGLNDHLAGKPSPLSEDEINQLIGEFQRQSQANRLAAAKVEGDAYLAENAKKPGVVVLASGLQYKVVKEGTGPKPMRNDTVRAHYSGKLVNGDEFDSSYRRNEPIVIGVGQVIPGWTEALLLMPVGSKWELYIPPDLGYGPQGSGPIPPNSVLIFEVELLEIVKQ